MKQSDLTKGLRVITPDGPGVVVHPSYCHPYHRECCVRVDNLGERLYLPSKIKRGKA